MKIYYLSQEDNVGYDTYDSCVVCAIDEADAKSIHPDFNKNEPFIKAERYFNTWAFSVDSVHCKEIGIANDFQVRGVICASFNAG